VDENIALWYSGVQDVTIRYSITSEALNDSLHPKGPHSMGMIVGGQNYDAPARISIYKNLFAHNHERNLLFAGDNDSSVFFANNLVYNWGMFGFGTSLRTGGDATAVGNVYISGANSGDTGKAVQIYGDSSFHVYLADIMIDGVIPNDPWTMVKGDTAPRVGSPPIWLDGYVVERPEFVDDLVLANAGARPADRDAVDIRVVQSVRDESGQLINSQSELGGWPNPPGVILNSRTLTFPSNPNGDSDGDGYTNLEEWLHSYAAQIEGGERAPAPTFADVPFDHWAHDYIETLYQAGYVSGCSTSPLKYCPEIAMTRSESAVFVERGIHSAGYTPGDPQIQIFEDVSTSTWYAKWATSLWEDGYTAGCQDDPLLFYPLQGHTRAEGTVFYLRMLNGPDYVPPDPVGVFSDVPVNFLGAKWIESAYNAGLLRACQTSPSLRFCPSDPLDRATAAFMMVMAKGLTNP
jgi:hypothetical protein